jgi:hypothetical protein
VSAASCWCPDWEEQELVRDEQRREEDDRLTVEDATELTPATSRRESPQELELERG